MTEGLLPPVNTTPKCRKTFEAWAKDHGFEVFPMFTMDAYFSSETDRAWFIWQSAWNAKDGDK